MTGSGGGRVLLQEAGAGEKAESDRSFSAMNPWHEADWLFRQGLLPGGSDAASCPVAEGARGYL